MERMGNDESVSVALYDVYNLNRKVVIRWLNPHFPMTELESWEAVEESAAQTFIISQPELMSAQYQSMFVAWLRKTKANVIITRYDFDLPWDRKINRLTWKRNVKILTKPNEGRLLEALQKFTPAGCNCFRLFETKYAT